MKASSIAAAIANDFYDGKLDLSARRVKQAPGWSDMPEVKAVCALRTSGHSKRMVRRFLTFVSAMDRQRDSDKLWEDARKMVESKPCFFDPAYVSDVPLEPLREVLSDARVSRFPGDPGWWQTIARSLHAGDGAVARVVEHGTGDAEELLKDLHGYRCRYPLLRGPKIGPMWVRIMVVPGGAKVENMDMVPVAVDAQVRRVTENLGVADTARHPTMEKARPDIQTAWESAVDGACFDGPSEIAGTCAALDPALWYFGKHGCSHCKKVNQPMPIGEACNSCQWTPGP